MLRYRQNQIAIAKFQSSDQEKGRAHERCQMYKAHRQFELFASVDHRRNCYDDAQWQTQCLKENSMFVIPIRRHDSAYWKTLVVRLPSKKRPSRALFETFEDIAAVHSKAVSASRYLAATQQRKPCEDVNLAASILQQFFFAMFALRKERSHNNS